jgi:hypothetical protein
VQDIPTSEKEEADFIATFNGIRVLIEEKTKEDNLKELAERNQTLKQGGIYATTLPLVRNNRLSGLITKAASQLQSSSDTTHDFRLMWFTGTGVNAQAKHEQFRATLYGLTNIIEMHSTRYRRCYFFRNSDFCRRANVIDGAVSAYINGNSISAKLCLNPLSPKYPALRQSSVLTPFGTAVEDPFLLEADGTAFILDSDMHRGEEHLILDFLRAKYKTNALMSFDLGYTNATICTLDTER